MTWLNRAFLWFYCLSIGDSALVVALGAVGFLWLRRRWGTKVWWKLLTACLLLCWLGAVVGSTVLSRASEGSETVLIPFHSYWTVLTGGEKELLRSNFMNLLLFFPGGLLLASLLPRKWPGWAVALTVGLLFTLVSGGIEVAQHCYGLGRAEVDDLLHNTAGALLGGWVAIKGPALPNFLRSRAQTRP